MTPSQPLWMCISQAIPSATHCGRSRLANHPPLPANIHRLNHSPHKALRQQRAPHWPRAPATQKCDPQDVPQPCMLSSWITIFPRDFGPFGMLLFQEGVRFGVRWRSCYGAEVKQWWGVAGGGAWTSACRDFVRVGILVRYWCVGWGWCVKFFLVVRLVVVVLRVGLAGGRMLPCGCLAFLSRFARVLDLSLEL
ncbi:hypothetical protein P153DRAFT_52459 [Dothidotthia symphoricarpi CBS 119687]|uniref:Uncharacterized protein n=1 Tax=Dothidotthia symphoricarpi CBS 119687 TaxID=1392245 RepID=A0A6A6A9U6_9PLEO|nr:uncharacterized protein P153DRAFT_52459 [Dothidotthia symphoricarpi CBS 119687]KAF2127617.1 hypothetical protein P153DRAFT_52459 [Dothidotthia symphoricarpi CBS 119687]